MKWFHKKSFFSQLTASLIFKRLLSNVLAGIFLNCVVFALKNMASVSNHKILGSSVAYSKDLSFQA